MRPRRFRCRRPAWRHPVTSSSRRRRPADLVAADLDRRCRRALRRGGAADAGAFGLAPRTRAQAARAEPGSTDRRASRSSTCRSCVESVQGHQPPPQWTWCAAGEVAVGGVPARRWGWVSSPLTLGRLGCIGTAGATMHRPGRSRWDLGNVAIVDPPRTLAGQRDRRGRSSARETRLPSRRPRASGRRAVERRRS